MDNLKVHHSKLVKNYCAKRNVNMIFNCSYFPDGNPIECCFAKVKQRFKALKTNQLVNNGKIVSTKELIDRSFAVVTKEDVVNSCAYAMKCFEVNT